MSTNQQASGKKKPVSLAPLTPEQALFAALNTPKPKAEKKAAKRRPKNPPRQS
jgi:hypothetical protein